MIYRSSSFLLCKIFIKNRLYKYIFHIFVTMKKIFGIIICLLLGNMVFAQDLSTLYRGRSPLQYPFKYNGTIYLESRLFSDGSVFYNGKLYENVLLNIDAYRQEVQVIASKAATPVVLYREQTAWIKAYGKIFVNLQYMGYKEAPVGFFELVKDGEVPVFLQEKKVYRSTTINQNGESGIGYYDPNYDSSVPNCFVRETGRYAMKDGKIVKINRREYNRRVAEKGLSGESWMSKYMQIWHSDKEFEGILSSVRIDHSRIGLPEGYFKPQNQDTVQIHYIQDNIQTSYKNKVYVIGEKKGKGNTAVLRGRVMELESDSPLTDVIIYDEKTKTYVRTDKQGRYHITLPLSENVLHFVYESKEPLDIRLDVLGDGSLDVSMNDHTTLLKEAVISASSMEQHRSTAMGIERVNIRTIGKIPSAFGEGDVLKAVLTLPGVKTVGEASGGFNVRGGSADENLILFNENTIYNPSHLFGIFSAFNPDIVENVEVYKSSVPAEYGGRLSSVMRVTSKEGDLKRVRGSLGVGVLTSRFHIEGPFKKEKTTFIAGARTTYSNWILKRLPSTSFYSGAEAGFLDVNAGLTHRFSDKDALQLSFYYANDRFTITDDMTNRYSNINASLIFRHRDTQAGSWQLAAGYDRYGNLTGDHSWDYGAYDLSTYINQVFLKGSWKKTFGAHEVSAGAQATGYKMDPGIMDPFGDFSGITRSVMNSEYGVEPSLYISDLWSINDAFSLEGGIRVSSFLYLKPFKPYIRPEVRLSGKYSPSETFSVKAGFNTMAQYIHLISNTTGISPMDTWKISDASILPTDGWQASAGIYWTQIDWGLDFSAETYWKQSVNALDFKPGAVLSMNPDLAEDLIPSRTRAYGVELMVKKPAGKLTGWISYSYSRARYREMQDRGNETIAAGNWYNAPYDKPHEFKVVANWAMTHRFSLSMNVDYSTGRPVTVPIGQYWFRGANRIAYSERNIHRIPDYFRVDLALNIDPGHYLKAIAHSSITIGVYNVLGRKNPYSVFFKPSGASIQSYMLSVFATQIPYINFNILF